MAGQSPQGYTEQLEEHSIEGLEILQGTSPFMAHALIYIILCLIFAGITWSFFTKADVIISASGKLTERIEAKRIYSPAAGELVEIFVSEGVPVTKGDLIARIKSPQAIQIASAATLAKLAYNDILLQKEQFPAKQKLLERELVAFQKSINLLTKDYQHQKDTGLRQLTDTQKRELKMLRLQLSEKEIASRQANDLFEKYERLSNSPGGGGISAKQLQEKKTEFNRVDTEYKQMLSRIDDMELTFSRQYLSNNQKIEQLNMQLIQSKLEYDKKKAFITQSAREMEIKFLAAQEAYEAASRIDFSDLDDNNFLVIRSPVTGEISTLSYRQPGEKVSPSTPLVTISEQNSGKIVTLSIMDKDRGLLKVGQQAKLKFLAFPYQRFGFLAGKIEYLSNSAKLTQDGRSLYKGKVHLTKDYYMANGKKLPVRLGMTANVEIVIQQRRVIDFALAPFRKLAAN